jgi:hypothetical protein
MANTTSGGLLLALKARIEALTPAAKFHPDDAYRVGIGSRVAFQGNRTVLLSCAPGRRIQGGRTCSDWETVIAIQAFYVDNPGMYEVACDDAEQIANELYDWVASAAGQTLGLLQVEPELANIAGDEGELEVSRFARFLYRGLP